MTVTVFSVNLEEHLKLSEEAHVTLPFYVQYHAANIINQGIINTTESNIHEKIKHYGPDVVWITNHILFNQGCIDLSNKRRLPKEFKENYDKHAIRITIDISDAQHWPIWSCKHKIKKGWYRRLARSGDPQSWYVVERCITQDDWIIIEDVQKGEVLWEKQCL